MPVANLQRGLQRFVVAAGSGFELIHINESWKCDGAGCRVDLIDVAVAKQLAPGGTNKANLNSDIGGQFLLNIRVVDVNVRCANILIDGKDVRGGKRGSVEHPDAGRDYRRR